MPVSLRHAAHWLHHGCAAGPAGGAQVTACAKHSSRFPKSCASPTPPLGLSPPCLYGPGIKAGFEKDASPEQDRGIRVTEAVVETMRDEKDMISGKKKRYE